VRYIYEGDAELQHIKVIGGNHTWYLNENQTDVSYFNVIHDFFTKGNGGNVGVSEPKTSCLHIWPNPANSQCTIELETDSNVEVFNLKGQIMATYTLKKGANPIDVSGLPKGMYFFKTAEGSVGKVMVR
jgi:hypothetical protein